MEQPRVPEKPSLEGLEAKWRARWEEAGTYRFDRTKTRDEIYSIDTPPPTVSGTLHPGHVFSFTHTDLVARYQRMRGREVFYPMGWDDNGLNTERRVQLMLGIACDPSLPYDPGFEPPASPPKPPLHVSRPNFVEQCSRIAAQLEELYHDLWSTVGLSVDWSMTYSTISKPVQKVSQRAFLRHVRDGIVYRREAPTLWDVEFKTAVAQAELQDREMPGSYHRVRFGKDDAAGAIDIETTRPELIPACVALVAHPDDERYKARFGTTISTPLFGVEVPIHAHELADPEKGSGIAMICTFGDTTDVTWWRELDLPVREIVGRDGRIVAEPPAGVPANDAWQALSGLSTKQAQKKIAELLAESGELIGDLKPITHPVKFWENGSRPLEIVTSRQWFLRFPPTDELLAYGKQIEWHPDYMRVRYENWVEGLQGDWNITRQRFFGVPFPVWYPVNDAGTIDHDNPILPAEDRLPIDPSTDVPDGYTAEQRDQPGGFTGDPDVMDTWATSSLSPELVGGWEDDADLFARVFPADLRPQAHDIIRTWLFYTVVRSHYLFGTAPWKHAAISGFIVDPDRKKLSKSKSNAEHEPMALIEKHGADAVRYWAARGGPGRDLQLDPNQFAIGRRLAIKVLNASKFTLGRLDVGALDSPVTEPADKAMLAKLADVVDRATRELDDYDYSAALEASETVFWSFCDDFIELVKGRSYGAAGEAGAASANRALAESLSVLLRLFAPYLPYATEEVWSWWQEGSVHRSPWPDSAPLRALAGDDADVAGLDAAVEVLGAIRRAKSEKKLSMRAPVERVVVTDSAEALARLRPFVEDLRSAGGVTDLDLVEGDPAVHVTVADPAATPS